MTHTPTPWRVSVHAIVGGERAADNGDKFGRTVARVTTGFPFSEAEWAANAARIVACVNACEGIEDPSKLIPDLRQSVVAMANEAGAARELRRDLDGTARALTQARAELSAARASASEAWAVAMGVTPRPEGMVLLHMTSEQAESLAQCLDFDLNDLSTVTMDEGEDGYEDFKRVEQVRELLKEQGL